WSLPAARRAAPEPRIDAAAAPLSGEPFAAAVEAASFRARLVALGSSAGVTSTLSSDAVRGKMLDILGHSNVFAPPDVKRAAYLRMAELAARGELLVDVESVPL